MSISAENNGRPIKFLEHPGSDDANHSEVPEQLAFHEDKVPGGIEAGADGADDFLRDGALDPLALPVLGIQTARDSLRLGGVLAEQQLQCFERILEPTGRVEPGGKLKSDFIAAHGLAHLGHLLERDQPGTLCLIEPLEAAAYQDPVLSDQRHQIGDSPERDQIQIGTDIDVERGAQTRLASALDQGVRQLEREARRTKLAKGRSTDRRRLGVDQGDGAGRRSADLMMVEHQDIHAPAGEPFDRRERRGAAIHGEEKRCGEFVEAVFHARLAQAIAFLHSMREIIAHRPAQSAQYLGEQGGRRHPIHIIVAKNDDWLAGFSRAEQPLDGHRHVGQEERIGEVLQPRLDEAGDGLRLAQPPVEEALGQKPRDVKLLG